MDQKPINPLRAHFRQPAIYLRLPSQGRFWNSGLDLPPNKEIPVFPMTARDEIMLKTPDALMNGQGVVEVVQSCCPNITNAWDAPVVDVDAILIAIRIASYGNSMTVDSICPHCSAENTYDIDLSNYLDNIKVPDYSQKLEHDNIKIKLKPQDYASSNETNKITYQQQRVLENLKGLEGQDDLVVAEYGKHLKKLVDLNAKFLVDNTEYIEISDSGTIVDNPEFIREFYFNCDADVCKELRNVIDKFNQDGAIKPRTAQCDSCKKEYDVPLIFDYANFFGKSS